MENGDPGNRKNGNSGGKRIRSAIGFGFSLLLFLLAVLVFVFSIQARKEGKQPEFFGYSFSVVLTDSMEPEIKVGDLVVVRRTAIENVQVGQNVVFVQRSGVLKGQRIIHRAILADSDEEGLYIRTQGVNEKITEPDPDRVRADNLVGVEAFHSTFLGWIVRNWLLILLLAILIPIIVKQIFKIVKYVSESKKENEK